MRGISLSIRTTPTNILNEANVTDTELLCPLYYRKGDKDFMSLERRTNYIYEVVLRNKCNISQIKSLDSIPAQRTEEHVKVSQGDAISPCRLWETTQVKIYWVSLIHTFKKKKRNGVIYT